MRRTARRFAALVLVAIAALAAVKTSAQSPAIEAQYMEARRFFDALDYENALRLLDELVAALTAAPAGDETMRQRQASVYEMRARAKFGLGDPEAARADFGALLRVAPEYALTGQVSPRVVALFEEAALATVGTIDLAVTPAGATVAIDGRRVSAGTVKIAAGAHVITAEQAGHRSASEAITVEAGATLAIGLELVRVSSVIRIATMPAEIDVVINGVRRGRTTAETPDGAGVLVVADVPNGTQTIELSRECYVRSVNRLTIDRPDDFAVGPVTLQPAVATLSVRATQPEAQVLLDGRDRGPAPLTVSDLCEGSHLVEVRTPFGRDSRSVEARTGETIAFDAQPRPTFAVVSASGGAGAPDTDLRVIVERAFASARTVSLVAPPASEAEQALRANQLSAGWLAVDASGRPVGAAAQIAASLRRDASARLAAAFGAQGAASITVAEGNRVVLALLAAGSPAPDVIEVSLDQPESVAAAVERLDRVLALSRPSIGLLAVDVADVPGPVIVAAGTGGAAAIEVGDRVVQADGQPIGDAAALDRIVAGRQPGTNIVLQLQSVSGQAKTATVDVYLAPRVIGLAEQGVLANRVLLDLRARLAESRDPFEQSVIRLNTAVALARAGDWAGARAELMRVQLPDRPGVANGTVQYLLGLSATALGSRAEAEAAFTAAAASASLLTEDGPPVKDLAAARLSELRGPTR